MNAYCTRDAWELKRKVIALQSTICPRKSGSATFWSERPKGSFVLQPGDRPIALIMAGIGVTPVLAMLHALVAGPLKRQVW